MKVKILLLFLVGINFFWILFTQSIAPNIIRAQIVALAKTCPDCNLSWKKNEFSLLGDTIVFSDIHLSQGDPCITAVEAKIPSIRVRLALGDLFKRELHIKEISIDNPEVKISEGACPSMPGNAVGNQSRWTYLIDSTQLRGGKFSYVKNYGKRLAIININSIEIDLGPIGTAIGAQESQGIANAQLEHTGHFKLTIKAPLYGPEKIIKLDLKIFDQNLADMSRYFETSSGLQLKGKLLKGHAIVSLLGKDADAWVRAEYKDFDIHFEKTKTRNALQTFFSNLVKTVKLADSDLKRSKVKQSRGTRIHRKNRESLVSFLLRGMLESSQKLVSN